MAEIVVVLLKQRWRGDSCRNATHTVSGGRRGVTETVAISVMRLPCHLVIVVLDIGKLLRG